ncbi:helix-turn-helix domain-containing protein [Streptomyces hydrogenans]|uniref:helix-turn-helix domain-containing protein n=1 Tax=Streptomyces hydrogenans TaxID=1873719 RepID=UPI0035DE86E6
MHDENERSEEAALAELRRRLGDELARRRWTKTQLARQAGLGRTTVSEAFQAGGPVPSEQTVAALAHALRLDVEELLELRRCAAAPRRPRWWPGRLCPGRMMQVWGD